MCVYGSHEARLALFSSSSLNYAGYEAQIPLCFPLAGMFHVAESTVIQVAQKGSKMRYGSRKALTSPSTQDSIIHSCDCKIILLPSSLIAATYTHNQQPTFSGVGEPVPEVGEL